MSKLIDRIVKRGQPAGVLLVEYIIGLSILAIVVPSIISGVFSMQHRLLYFQKRLHLESEWAILDYWIRQDLKLISSFKSDDSSMIQAKLIDGRNLRYRCEKERLKRSIQTVGKRASTVVLNPAIDIWAIQSQRLGPQLIRIKMDTQMGEKILEVFLPNEQPEG